MKSLFTSIIISSRPATTGPKPTPIAVKITKIDETFYLY